MNTAVSINDSMETPDYFSTPLCIIAVLDNVIRYPCCLPWSKNHKYKKTQSPYLKQLHPDDASSQRQHKDHQYTHKDLEKSVGTDPMPELVAVHSSLQRFLRVFHITDEGSCCHAEWMSEQGAEWASPCSPGLFLCQGSAHSREFPYWN